MGDKNIIELNGKRYNALTGALLQVSKKAQQATHKAGQSIDSVVSKAQPKSAEANHQSRPLQQKPSVSYSSNVRPAHKPQQAKTLMRSSVKKPTAKPKAAASLQTPASFLPTKLAATLPAAARAALNERRLALSQQVSKSRLISRFRPIDTMVSKQIKPLPVKQPAPTTAVQAQPTPTKTPKGQDIFAIGLAKATSHEQKFVSPKRAKRAGKRHSILHKLGLALAIIIVIVVASIIIDNNLPGVELRIATARSGVHATLPTYKPAGFKTLTPIKYAPDTVTINFKSTSSGQFSLTEQNSDWDSQTLRDSFVGTTDPSYKTLQYQGRTIYIYGNGNTTWVNGGIWYQISGGSGLTNHQLLDIAASL